MPMFIEIFLMLCIIAQPQVCTAPQPMGEKILAESATVDHKSTIFSLINIAGNCTAYEGLKSEPKFRQLEEYCERPLPDTPRADEFVSYETILCMVLYDAAQRVCKVGHQEFTKDVQNFNGSFSCDTIIKGVPEASGENTKQWITLFKAKLENISYCERACVQNKFINPVCVYIWKTISLTYKAQVSSAISADTSRTENQVNSKGHGKTNKTMTSKHKPSETKAFDLSSSAGSGLSIQSSGSQNTEQGDHKMTPTNESAVRKDVDLAEANGNSTQSGSAIDVKNNVKEKVHTKNSNLQNDFNKQAQATGHNDAKKQTHTADSNTQNDMNKQAHGINSNVQNITKKQEPAINSSNHSAGVTSHSAPFSHSVHTERLPEASKHDDSTGKSTSSDSKSNTASQPENKSSPDVHALDHVTENKNDDDDEFVMRTVANSDNVEDTSVVGNSPSGDGNQEEDKTDQVLQEEQPEQISQQIETNEEDEETDNTAQFNQLGDVADSHFYAYFMTMVVICIIGYLVFHNKQKILALALEGRSRRGTRRRPNTSAYRKLDSNLEEAVTSTGSTSVTHVIY